ncbi:MAG TPA: YbfB/YjiJ family MFS transporter [Oleiagrimonas sp.]|nr:YbfB/YjiJ family MFS transporter [Oleiagrimonas sp.]
MTRELRTALIGMTLLALALGIGRFVLTPLLPLMQADSGLGLVAGGWLASTNLLGYLLGALACALWSLRPRASLRAGAVAVVVATLGMGLTTNIDALLAWRFVAGVASAVLVVYGIAWSMARLRAGNHALLEHLVFSGTGIGIVVSGVTVAVLHPLGASSAELWAGLGVVTGALFGWMWRRMGESSPTVTGKPSAPVQPTPPSGPAWPLLAMYGLLGFAYMIPASFLPLIAGNQLHLPALREWFWPLFGLATAASTLALRWLPARIDNRTVLAACAASMVAGMVLCIIGHSIVTLLLATILIGSACMPVVMYTMREAQRLAPRNHVRLVAALTATFGVGQAAGPVFAAWLAARSGSFNAALAVGAIIAAIAMLCMLVRSPRRAPAQVAAGFETTRCS